MVPEVVKQMMSRYGIDINAISNIRTPDEMAQFLLNSGKVNQSQVNQVKQMWNIPQVQQQILGKYR